MCHITFSTRCYFIKTGITYSHSTKKFSIQVHYYDKMYNCIAIKVSWYMRIEENFFSSDLYKAKHNTLQQWPAPDCYSLVFFILKKRLRDIDNCTKTIYYQKYLLPSVRQSLTLCLCMSRAKREITVLYRTALKISLGNE